MAPTQLPAILLIYIEAIKPSLNVLAICAVWLGISIPLMFLLFASSTPALRRKPLFMFNVVSVFIGIAMGVLNLVILIRTLGDPINGISKPVYVVYICLTVSVELFIDSILLFRVFSVFPISATSRRTLALVFCPLLLLKMGRAADILIFLVKFVRKTLHLQTVQSALADIAKHMPEARIAWGLQLADNGLCSAIFLWKLHEARALSGRCPSADDGQKTKYTYASKLRDLFWIAASNFVFPAFFNISLLILVSIESGNPNNYWMVMICSIYVEIIGVLFATIWVSGSGTDSFTNTSTTTGMRSMQFALNDSSTIKGSGRVGKSSFSRGGISRDHSDLDSIY